MEEPSFEFGSVASNAPIISPAVGSHRARESPSRGRRWPKALRQPRPASRWPQPTRRALPPSRSVRRRVRPPTFWGEARGGGGAGAPGRGVRALSKVVGGERREAGRKGGGREAVAKEELVAPAAAWCRSLRASSPGRARRRRQRRRGDGVMRRYLRVVVLCLACGFCSLLYAFSQLAVSLEEGAGGGGGKPQAAAASWLAGGGRGAGRGAGSAGSAAHPGRSDRYGPFPVGGRGAGRGGAGLRPARAACGSAPRLPTPGPRLPLLCRRL